MPIKSHATASCCCSSVVGLRVGMFVVGLGVGAFVALATVGAAGSAVAEAAVVGLSWSIFGTVTAKNVRIADTTISATATAAMFL